MIILAVVVGRDGWSVQRHAADWTIRGSNTGEGSRFFQTGPGAHPASYTMCTTEINPLNAELNPTCYLLALLGTHQFLHVSRIRVKLLIFRLLMS